MNGKALFLSLALAVFATASVSAQNDVVAGIPVNYDESKVGDYKLGLPDPLVMNNGKKVKATVKDGKVTVKLPKGLKQEPVALKFSI